MAKTNPVYVYDKDCRDFTTTGLAGDLKPLSAMFQEEKNGMCQITVRLRYDQYERWKHAKVGNIIRCKVPVRVPPVIEDDEYATSTTKYRG